MTSRRGRASVLIAEDDALYRATLANVVDWEVQGCFLKGVVSDGEAAIEFLRKHAVDILITDVEMPGMSGVDLVVAARALRPSIQCLVISNFDTFDYVRSALHHGAVDYLLKQDVDENTLGEIVRKLASHVWDPHGIGRPPEEEARPHPVLRRDLIRSLLVGTVGPNDAGPLVETHMPNLVDRRLQLIVFHMNNYRRLVAELPSSTSEAQYVATLLELMEQVLPPDSVITSTGSNRFAVVVRAPEDGSEIAAQAQVLMISRRLEEVVLKFFNASLESRHALVRGGMSGLHEAWRTATRELDETAAGPKLSENDGGGDWVSLTHMQEAEIANAVRSGDGRAARKITSRILEEARRAGSSYNSLLMLGSEILYLGVRICRNMGMEPRSVLGEIGSPTRVLADASTLDEIIDYVGGILAETANNLRCGSHLSPLVAKASLIINREFRDDLSVTSIATRLGVSPSYLSRKFNSEVGHGIPAELNERRIAHAKTLLIDPRLEIKQVARQSGFSGYTYFFTVFRKLTGVTPQEWRLEPHGPAGLPQSQ